MRSHHFGIHKSWHKSRAITVALSEWDKKYSTILAPLSNPVNRIYILSIVYCVTPLYYTFLEFFILIYEGKELSVYIEDIKPIIKPLTSEIVGLANHEYKYYVIGTMQGCPRGRPCTHKLYCACMVSRVRCAAGPDGSRHMVVDSKSRSSSG